jgi:hypothetical protein
LRIDPYVAAAGLLVVFTARSQRTKRLQLIFDGLTWVR